MTSRVAAACLRANPPQTQSFRDGKPSELDTYWRADGRVLRDGGEFGQVRLDPFEQVVVKFVLELPGETIELEGIAAY